MKKYVVAIFIVELSVQLSIAQNFRFKIHEIGRHGELMGQTALVDLD